MPLHAATLRPSSARPRHGGLPSFDTSEMIGRGHLMQNLVDLLEKVSRSDSAVLIGGESGTGKELVAKLIHRNSQRHQKPLLSVNCTAMTDSLLDSELFGHRKGSFTSAHEDRKGLFHQADRGTIFLDEVGCTSSAMQAKLLRVLQEKEVRRVGDNQVTHIDVRVLAATNTPLRKLIEEGKFREDLYYRLNVLPIHVPPLRDRTEDIPLLALHFLQRFDARKRTAIRHDTMEMLMNFPWPGNIRQLEHIIERMVVFHGENKVLTPSHLPDLVTKTVEELGLSVRLSDRDRKALELMSDMLQPTDAPSSPTEEAVFETESETEPKQENSQPPRPLGTFLHQQEKRHIEECLARCRGDKHEAARMLGVSIATLYRKLSYFASITPAYGGNHSLALNKAD